MSEGTSLGFCIHRRAHRPPTSRAHFAISPEQLALQYHLHEARARAPHTHLEDGEFFAPLFPNFCTQNTCTPNCGTSSSFCVCARRSDADRKARARAYPHFDTYTHTNQAATRARTNDTQWAQRPVVENLRYLCSLSKYKQTCHRKFVSAPIRGIPQCNNTRTLALSAHAHSLAG